MKRDHNPGLADPRSTGLITGLVDMRSTGMSRRLILAGAVGMALTGAAAEANAARLMRGHVGASSIPAAINAPVVGTDLTAVWNLQNTGAVGAPATASNGTWSGGIDSYLSSIGGITFQSGTNKLIVNTDHGTGIKEITDYRFPVGSPEVNFSGQGIGRLKRTLLEQYGGSCTMPTDNNGNVFFGGRATVVDVEDCTFSVATFYMGSGTLNFRRCLVTGQLQGWGDVGGGPSNLLWEDCYIPGCGNGPIDPLAHSEITRFQFLSSPRSSWIIRRCHINIGAEQQSTTTSPADWTAILSPGQNDVQIIDTVMRGGNKVNTNPNPHNAGPTVGRVLVGLTYNELNLISYQNCALEKIGTRGFTAHAGAAGPYRPSVDGNTRELGTNTQITQALFD